MAARTARKKTTRKTTRKAATRKKTARKKAAPRKAARKKTTRKKAAAKARPRSAWERLERELPPTLKQFSRELRKDLNEAEKAIVGARRPSDRQGLAHRGIADAAGQGEVCCAQDGEVADVESGAARQLRLGDARVREGGFGVHGKVAEGLDEPDHPSFLDTERLRPERQRR